jgi:hypothetical protein
MAEVLQFVTALRVARAIGRVAVTKAPGHLDDEVDLAPAKVDPSDVAPFAPDSTLRLGTGQVSAAYESEEAAFEDRLATAVQEKPVEPAHPSASSPTNLGEPFSEHQGCREAKSDGAIDGRAKTILANAGGSEVENGARRRRTSEAAHRDDIEGTDVAGGVHDRAGNGDRPAPTRHGELHAPRQRSIEAGGDADHPAVGDPKYVPVLRIGPTRAQSRDQNGPQRHAAMTVGAWDRRAERLRQRVTS